MITDIEIRRMVVISDLHLGNPFCDQPRRILRFLEWASEQGYDICINGDGLEISQLSFEHFSRDVPRLLRVLKRIADRGRRVYYVVGNHDMAMEHFLDDWGALAVTPFLNLHSGHARIRIEHGHLYDPFFVNSPKLYEFSTWVGGLILSAMPGAYRLWVAFERWRSRLRGPDERGLMGEPPQFQEAAEEIARRGFDVVVFGHTHHPGERGLPYGARYLNPGSWLLGTWFVRIEDGEVTLESWDASTGDVGSPARAG